MTRAIATGGWTLLFLSAGMGSLCGATMYAQNPRLRGMDNQQSAPVAPHSPQTASSAPQTAPQAVSAPSQSFTAAAQTPPSLLEQPAKEAQILFADNSLSIRADNSSLATILRQVATTSGMKLEGLGNDERVFGSFGPGAPRDVLADLMDGTAYNLVLLGDLSNGAPRELILTPATHSAGAGAAVAPTPMPQGNADEASNEPENVEPPPPPEPPQQSGATPPAAPGVRTPQQLFEQLQRMRQGQNQGQQSAQPPVQQDSPQP